jgi:phage terminase large subunit GpA-like protein
MGQNGEVVSGCSPDFFAMLTAEKRVRRQDKKGFYHYEWIIQGGARNEAIDCFVYSRAALRIAYPNDAETLRSMTLKEPWAMKNAIPKTTPARITPAAPVARSKPRIPNGHNSRAREKAIRL